MVRNFWYLVFAYTAIWGAVFGYLVYLAAQARALRREAQLLTRIIRQEPETQPEPPSSMSPAQPAADTRS